LKKSGKKGKRIVGFLAASSVVWSAFFITDYYKCEHFELPVFVVHKKSAAENNSASYNGLGYTVNVELDENKEILSVTMIMFGKVISASIK